MLSGALRSNNPLKSVVHQLNFFAQFKSVPFDDAAALEYARIRAELLKRGTQIGPNDFFRFRKLIIASREDRSSFDVYSD